MGPRLVSRGETSGLDLAHPPPVASMGPRLVSRGEVTYGGKDARRNEASMGPRLVSRGEMTEMEYLDLMAGFNGAAACEPRREDGGRL